MQAGRPPDSEIADLVESIRKYGVREPLVVTLVLLYWVIGVDETFVVAIGYVLCGDRAVQARCDPTGVGTRG